MKQFTLNEGNKRKSSVARTLQQNRLAERKNRTLIEVTRTMLADFKLPTTFWAEAVNTACPVSVLKQSNGKAGNLPEAGIQTIREEKDSDGNSTNNVNAVSLTVNAAITEVNTIDPKTSIELPNDANMPELEDIVFSDDDEDVDAEADLNNLDAFMPVSPILTTRIHKDHPVEQIIADLNSAP
ncbi:ribonuclease H-like domain-containing protein [Tanacetum coccineum]